MVDFIDLMIRSSIQKYMQLFFGGSSVAVSTVLNLLPDSL